LVEEVGAEDLIPEGVFEENFIVVGDSELQEIYVSIVNVEQGYLTSDLILVAGEESFEDVF